MRKFAIFSTVFFTLLTCSTAIAQDFSNKGKEFWLAYSYHVGMAQGGNPVMTLYITSDVNTPYTVEIYGVATIQTGNITAGQVVTAVIPTAYFINNEGTFTNSSIRVTADKPVVVYSYITRSAISGATVCLPTNVLGKEYYAMSFTQVSNEANSNSYFTIIAVEDNTGIEITPSANTKNGWLANTTYTVNLNKGQIYQVLGTVTGNNGVDLSGSKIKSVASATGGCKRIAVFSGSGKISIGCAAASTSDNLYQQLYPLASWGQKYLTVPSYNRPTNYYRIAKSNVAANVYLNGVLIPPASFVNNIYYEFFNNNVPNKIESDLPVSVTQYFTTQGCSGNGAPYDPDMIVLNPVEQNISRVTLVSSNLVAANPQHHLHIIMKNSGTGISSFRLDNVLVSAALWTIHPQDAAYSYLYLSNVAQGYHTLASDSGFNALAYGYATFESYGYSAGANVKDLYQFVSVQNQYATVNFPAACKSSPFYFSMTFPYQPTQIIWDFSGLFPNVTLNNPVFDSTWVVNGKQLYLYRLPTPYTINTVGTYPIKVFAQNPTSDGCGGTQEIEYDLQVFSPPVADFTFTNNGCVTNPVSFLDNSNTGGRPVISRYWNFGDASISASNNPTHTYVAPGSYTVKYALITDVGCLSDTTSHVVNLNNLPAALFTISSPRCQNKTVTFSDQSTTSGGATIVKWFWDFGDATPPDTSFTNADKIHTYVATGIYNVTLKVETTTGCQSTVYTFPVVISPNPVPGFTFPDICLPVGAALFNNTSAISDGTQGLFTYNWNFGDGSPNVNTQNPLHNFPGTGPYNVTLTVTSNNGCIDSVMRLVNTIYAQPQSGFTSSPELCLGATANFTDQSTAAAAAIVQWFWDFGDASPISIIQNPTHNYAAAGTYTIRHWVLTDKGCYSDTLSRQIVINPLPTANFNTGGPYCVTRNITFTDASAANAGNIISWQWNLGDATILNLTNNTPFNHQYAATGIYPITLQVTTDKGCISTVYNGQVDIKPLPVPDFTHTRVCLPDGISNFTNTSSVANGASLSYTWNFGDPSSGVNNTSSLANPSHYFSSVGPYNITLLVLSGDGCTKDSMKIVSDIYAQADGEFTVNAENCLNDVTSFTSTSNPLPGNTVAQWQWDFGDASASTLQNPTHTYAAAGTYTIRHWIVTDKGCNSDTAIHIVVVNPLPTANYNFSTPACETKVISFTDLSVANAGALNGWTWNFGDGSPVVTTQNPTHTFVAWGAYTVTLIATSTKGCVSSVFSRQVIINPQPVPGFISPEVCLSDAFAQFVDTTRIASGSISTWLWSFGDPPSGPLNTSTLQNPQHRYNAIGNYTATLTVTSNNGCISTLTQSFTVNGDIPVSNFNALNPAALCANDSVAIQDASTVNFGNITKVEIYWDNVGAPAVFQTDDLPFPGKIYRHLYPNFQAPLTRTYTIRYRAYSGATCINDRIKTIVVNAAPRVQFTIIPDICLDAAPYQITQASEIGGVPGSAVFSGPGITAGGLFTPSLVGPGTYTIRYTYTSIAGGCVDTISKTIKVLEPPVASFEFAGPACETQTVTFNDFSTTVEGTLTVWTWDFADGTPLVIRNTGASFTHIFAAYGTYAVKLRVTTSNGCVSVQKVINVTVNPLPKPNFSIPASACLPNANVTFNNLSTIADGTQSTFSYLWNFGDLPSGAVNTSTGANPSHTYVTIGPFNINLQVTSGAGCIDDTMIVLNTVHPQPLASFTADKPEVCIGGNFIFTDNSNSLDGTTTQWNWVMDDGNVRNTPAFTYTYSAPGTYNVSLFIFNNHGCRSTTYTSPITVHPYPVVDAGPDRFVLEGGIITLEPIVTGNDLTYLWTPNLHFTGSNAIRNPFIKGVDDQTYLLTVTARGGCVATDQVFVKVLKTPVIPNIFSPNGDGVHDRWVIEYLESYPGCIVQIYNRYGQMVQRYINYTTPWDGKINGKDAPIGTYYYIVDPKNGRKPLTGFVDIIR